MIKHDDNPDNVSVKDDGTSAQPPQRAPLWWGVVEWLPAKVFTPCATCMFWRGAAFGAIVTGALAVLK